jgi:hypothetical protein
MQDQMRCPGFASRSLAGPLSLLMLVTAHSTGFSEVASSDHTGTRPEPMSVFAQAGSTGGSVANQGKSVSGEQDTDHSRGPTERRPQPQPRAKAKPAASFEGTWHGVSTGSCIHDYTWTLQVRNGAMSGNGSEGHVSPGGATLGSMTVLGTRYIFKGHAAGPSRIAGTWTRPDGCSGIWTTNSISE